MRIGFCIRMQIEKSVSITEKLYAIRMKQYVQKRILQGKKTTKNKTKEFKFSVDGKQRLTNKEELHVSSKIRI